MNSILRSKQKWNKRGVELTINFIVTLILALAAFALGAVIIRTLTSGGVDSITLTQDQLNQKISQLSCSARDKICVSNNNKGVAPGELVVSGLAVFNYLNSDVTLDITVEPKRAYTQTGDAIDLSTFGPGTDNENMPKAMFSSATLDIGPRKQGQMAIGILTQKATPKGTYLFRVSASDPAAIFETISDEISIIVK